MTLVADMSQFRNLILSLFMSKQAREKMDAFHAKQRGVTLSPDGAQSTEEVTKASPRRFEPPSTAMIPDNKPSEYLPIPDVLTDEEVAAAVRAAVARIEEAEKQAVSTNLTQPPRRRSDPSIGRADLIKQAITIHRTKQSVLDELDEGAREKLSAMAMQAFQIDKVKK